MPFSKVIQDFFKTSNKRAFSNYPSTQKLIKIIIIRAYIIGIMTSNNGHDGIDLKL